MILGTTNTLPAIVCLVLSLLIASVTSTELNCNLSAIFDFSDRQSNQLLPHENLKDNFCKRKNSQNDEISLINQIQDDHDDFRKAGLNFLNPKLQNQNQVSFSEQDSLQCRQKFFRTLNPFIINILLALFASSCFISLKKNQQQRKNSRHSITSKKYLVLYAAIFCLLIAPANSQDTSLCTYDKCILCNGTSCLYSLNLSSVQKNPEVNNVTVKFHIIQQSSRRLLTENKNSRLLTVLDDIGELNVTINKIQAEISTLTVSNTQVALGFSYFNNIEGKQGDFTFTGAKLKTATLTEYLTSSNGLTLHYYERQTYERSSTMEIVVTIFVAIALLIIFLSLFVKVAFVIFQMFTALQLMMLFLTVIDTVSPDVAALSRTQYLMGYNGVPFVIDFDSLPETTKILTILNYPTAFLANFNIMMILYVVIGIASFVIFLLKSRFEQIKYLKLAHKLCFRCLLLASLFNMDNIFFSISLTKQDALDIIFAALVVLAFGFFISISIYQLRDLYGFPESFNGKRSQLVICAYLITFLVCRIACSVVFSATANYSEKTTVSIIVLAILEVIIIIFVLVARPYKGMILNIAAVVAELILVLYCGFTAIGASATEFEYAVMLLILICIAVLVLVLVFFYSIYEGMKPGKTHVDSTGEKIDNQQTAQKLQQQDQVSRVEDKNSKNQRKLDISELQVTPQKTKGNSKEHASTSRELLNNKIDSERVTDMHGNSQKNLNQNVDDEERKNSNQGVEKNEKNQQQIIHQRKPLHLVIKELFSGKPERQHDQSIEIDNREHPVLTEDNLDPVDKNEHHNRSKKNHSKVSFDKLPQKQDVSYPKVNSTILKK